MRKMPILVLALVVVVGFALSGCSGKASWYELDSLLDMDSESLRETLINAFGEEGIQTSTVLGNEEGELVPQLTCKGNPEENPFGATDFTLYIQLVDDKTWDAQPNFFDEYNKDTSFDGQTIKKKAGLSFVQSLDYSLWNDSFDSVQNECGFTDVIGDKESSDMLGSGLDTVFYSTLTRYGKCQIDSEDALWSIRFIGMEGGNETIVSIEVEPLSVSGFSSYEDVQNSLS